MVLSKQTLVDAPSTSAIAVTSSLAIPRLRLDSHRRRENRPSPSRRRARPALCRCDRAPIQSCDRQPRGSHRDRRGVRLLAGRRSREATPSRVRSTGALSVAPGSGGAVTARGRLLRGRLEVRIPSAPQVVRANRRDFPVRRIARPFRDLRRQQSVCQVYPTVSASHCRPTPPLPLPTVRIMSAQRIAAGWAARARWFATIAPRP